MTRAMWRELAGAFTAVQADAGIRCVTLRGAGMHFCAGGDISEYAQFRFGEASLRDFHEEEVWPALAAMLDCDVPIVACIEGNCMGAGLEIASCCDLRIGAESARFGAPIAKLGFPMAPREAALVLRAVGELTAREMLLSAAVLPAAEMKARGFLNQVLADAAAWPAASDCAARIGRLAAGAARANKQTFRALAPVSIGPDAIDLIANAYAYADSPEHREGIAAFVEKRGPRFRPPGATDTQLFPHEKP